GETRQGGQGEADRAETREPARREENQGARGRPAPRARAGARAPRRNVKLAPTTATANTCMNTWSCQPQVQFSHCAGENTIHEATRMSHGASAPVVRLIATARAASVARAKPKLVHISTRTSQRVIAASP